jgi:DNA-directed RNA polymerase subunit RPC12/RpoP
MTEEEMYALEFSPEELCEEPSAEEPETEYHCPVCHASELQYAMHYRVSDDDETQELYRCARCGATGEADDCRVELVLRRRNPSRFTSRRTASSNTRSRFSGLATTIVSRVASAWKSPVWNAPFDLDIPPVRMRRRRAGRGTGSRTATRGRR